jgi:hypothetical protein
MSRYCFLFESTWTVTKRRSVRDVLVNAKDLAIDVQLLKGSSPPLFGLVLFFDAKAVDMRRIASASYQCELSRRGELISWTFKQQDGAWVSAHPPFDAETDTLCSPQ